MSLIRILFPKWAERRRVAKLANEARPKAYEDARRMFAVRSVAEIAFEYDLDGPMGWARGLDSIHLDRHEREFARSMVIDQFVCANYRREARGAAVEGAWQGVREFEDAESDRDLAEQAERRAVRRACA